MRRSPARSSLGSIVLFCFLVPVLSLMGALGDATPASAHVSKTVGKYQLTVGWHEEPVYIDTANAVELLVRDTNGMPVDDIGDGLHVVVSYGERRTEPLTLGASFDPDTGLGTHGLFEAPITPTQVGNFSFEFVGDISGQRIDETFTSGPQTFNAAESPSAVMFPAKDQTLSQLTQSVDRLQARVDSVSAKAKSASTLAVAALACGVALGLGGLAFGVMARVKPRKMAGSRVVERPVGTVT